MADSSEPAVASNPEIAFEKSDWRLRPIGLALLFIFAVLAASPFILMWAFPHSVSDVSRKLTIRPPGPGLQVNPPQDLAHFRAHEEKLLNTYYWIDKDKGIVHIPIDEAMKKVVRDGIDGFPKGQP
jgi:hypothetical protein